MVMVMVAVVLVMVMVVVMMAHWKKLIFAAAPQLLISSKVDKCCKCRKDICHTLKIFVTRFHTLKIIVTRFHTLKSTFLSQRLHQQPTLFDHTLFCHPASSKMPQICFRDWPTGLEELHPPVVADLEIKFHLLLFQIRAASGHGRRFVFPFPPIRAKGTGVQLCNV